MSDNDPRLGLPQSGGEPAAPLLARVFAFATAAVVLVAALFFSVIVFAVLLVVGAVAGAWLWWQTREVRGELRARMREAQRNAPPGDLRGGDVIEGDYIRETDAGSAGTRPDRAADSGNGAPAREPDDPR
ncbi:MAG: hypothetical protein KJZ83_16840 [Burkholderiaceae bacterium]|nr:hypothetical protein [Burkholderiaceae bacterium]